MKQNTFLKVSLFILALFMLPNLADAQRHSQNRGQGNHYNNGNQRNYNNQRGYNRGRMFRAPRRPRVAICLPPIPRVVPYIMGGRQHMRRNFRNHHNRHYNYRGRGRSYGRR
jgi:hypothetical protein